MWVFAHDFLTELTISQINLDKFKEKKTDLLLKKDEPAEFVLKWEK